MSFRVELFSLKPGSDEYPLPDPTRTLFWVIEPDPNFSKFLSFALFPAGYFPAGRFKSSNNNPQILLFSCGLDMKSSVSKVKCIRYKKDTK